VLRCRECARPCFLSALGPALYACCNLAVVRAVALDHLGFASVTLEGLTLDTWPMYVKVRWSGQLVDLAPPEGIAAAGSPSAYPEGACLSFFCPRSKY
jgi:hypothetical protein